MKTCRRIAEMLGFMRLDGCCNTAPSLSKNRIRGAMMPAHRKYFNLPESKTCPECGKDFPRPPSYAHDRWFKAELCSLSCASIRGARIRSARRAENFAAIFDGLIDRTPGQGPQGECWEWTGTRYDNGYGRIGFGGKSLKAHRIALFGIDGYDNPLMACHTCDNPPCVRKSHLFPGTGLTNTQDKMFKGRHHGNHRLTEEQVMQIVTDPRIYREIATEYGISLSNVGAIKTGKTWKGVAG